MTRSKPVVLIATEVSADANVIKRMLRDEFDDVDFVTSTDPDQSVQDFEKHRPAVLILAFNSLEKAERYYLGLYRLGKIAHALPHRTLILCSKDDLQQVYALCRKEQFDDYVLFWPMNQDGLRLPMVLHRALHHMQVLGSGVPTAAEFAAQARRIAELESLLDQSVARGGEHVEMVGRTLKQAQADVGLALDGFSSKLLHGARADASDARDDVQRDVERLKTDEIGRHFQSVAAATRPLAEWVGTIKTDLAPQLAAARILKTLADRTHPVVLVVDDDEFQQKLLARVLASVDLDPVMASSGMEALALARKCRPDLVLMDINLPDIDGIDVMRRLKSVAEFSDIPVIMITGKSDKNLVIESLKGGASDFVVKPFDRDILLAKIQQHLQEA